MTKYAKKINGVTVVGNVASGGITSLNGLTVDTQTFVNDTNVTIVSSGSTHTLTWAGTLADGRIASASVWNSKQAGSANLTSLSALSYVSGAFVKMTGANTFTLDTNTYLTSLSGAFLVGGQNLVANDKLGSTNNVSWDLVANNLPVIRVTPVASSENYLAISPSTTSGVAGNDIIIEAKTTGIATSANITVRPLGTAFFLKVQPLATNKAMFIGAQTITSTESSVNQVITTNSPWIFNSGSTTTLTPNIQIASSITGNSANTRSFIEIIPTVSNISASVNLRGVRVAPTFTSANPAFACFESEIADASNRFAYRGLGTGAMVSLGSMHIGSVNTPNASCVLELTSTSKGFLMPRMITSSKTSIVSPVDGLIVFDTTIDSLSYYSTEPVTPAWVDVKVKYSESFDSSLISAQVSPSGVAYIVRFKPKSDIIAKSIEFIVTSFGSTETFYCGIYDETLTTKISDGSVSVTSSGTKTCTVTSVKLTGATTYYLVIKDDNGGTNSVGNATTFGSSILCRSLFVGSGALPASLSSSTVDTKSPHLAVVSI